MIIIKLLVDNHVNEERARMKQVYWRCGRSLFCMILILQTLYRITGDSEVVRMYHRIVTVGAMVLIVYLIDSLWLWALLTGRQRVWFAFKLDGKKDDFAALRQSVLRYWDIEDDVQAACRVLVGTLVLQVVVFAVFVVCLMR